MVQLKGDEKARYLSAMFDGISRRYDLMNTVMSSGMHRLWRRRAARQAAQAGAGDALDIATGTGDFALELARRPGEDRVVGLDFAPRMLPIARYKANKRGLSPKIDWVLGDALNLPFPDDRFACITVGFGLRNFADKETALSEMLRVLKPGGRVVVLDIVPIQGKSPFHRLLRAYFRGVVPRLGMLVAGNKEAYTYLPESVDNHLTPRQLADLMGKVGLQHVRYETMGFGTVALHVGEKPAQP